MERSRQQQRLFITVGSNHLEDFIDKVAAEAETLRTSHGKGAVALVFNTFDTRRAVSWELGASLRDYLLYAVDTFILRDQAEEPAIAAVLVVGPPTYARLMKVDSRFTQGANPMRAQVTYIATAPDMEELRRNLASIDTALSEAAANADRTASALQVSERQAALALQHEQDRKEAVERTKQSLRDLGGQFSIETVGMDDVRDPTKNAGAASELSRLELTRHMALDDVNHRAQIGALEDLLNEIARDLGTKPGDFQALRSAILQTRLGRNAPELWAAWMTGTVDLMGMQALPRVGHMAPIHHAVRAMMQAHQSDSTDRKVTLKEQAVLEAAAPTLALMETATGNLRKLFSEAAERAEERRQQAAAGTDTPQAVVQGLDDLLVRVKALGVRDDMTEGEQNAMNIVASHLSTLQRTAEALLPPINIPAAT